MDREDLDDLKFKLFWWIYGVGWLATWVYLTVTQTCEQMDQSTCFGLSVGMDFLTGALWPAYWLFKVSH